MGRVLDQWRLATLHESPDRNDPAEAQAGNCSLGLHHLPSALGPGVDIIAFIVVPRGSASRNNGFRSKRDVDKVSSADLPRDK